MDNLNSRGPLRAPRGTELSCRNWISEAALRMLLNNLDPQVAERPQDLVVYGGSGKGARELGGLRRSITAPASLGGGGSTFIQYGEPGGGVWRRARAPRGV